jgi:hypothetical protein
VSLEPRPKAIRTKTSHERAGDRAFKARHFAKQARAGGIADKELCEAVKELRKGQGDALGGNVWKKRLDKNRQRSIVLHKAGHFWVFVFLFAKKDRENITLKELAGFKKLSKDYQSTDIERLVKDGEIQEICNESDD